MTKWFLCLVSLLMFMPLFAQKRQTIGYDGKLYNNDTLVLKKRMTLNVSIIQGTETGPVAYAEKQEITTDSSGTYHVDIGSGSIVSGNFDSIIWSDGVFYLRTALMQPGSNTLTGTRTILLRIPPDLGNDFEQGTVIASDYPDFGSWSFINTRHKRPRLVTVDLTTAYANLAYPANTYPIYRHFEWCDPERDGKGKCFLSFHTVKTPIKILLKIPPTWGK